MANVKFFHNWTRKSSSRRKKCAIGAEENGVMSVIICFTTKCFEEDETKGDEMSRTCSRHGSDGRRLQYFIWKTWKDDTTLESSVYVG